MSTYSGPASIFSGNPFDVDEANPSCQLGTLMVTPDGRKYRYVKVGITALVVGNLLQGPAEDTGDQDLAVAAATAGLNYFTTTSTVTVTANQYAGGYAAVTVTPDLGRLYRIKSHPAATSAVVTITLDEPIQTSFTTDTRIDLYANPYNGVIQNPTAASGPVVGVAVKAITAGQYGWIQTGGIANILSEAVAVGLGAVAGNGTPGAVETAVSDSTESQAYVGQAVMASTAGQCGLFKLNIGD